MKRKALIICSLVAVLFFGIGADAAAHGRRGWHRGHAYGHRYYRPQPVWVAPPPPPVVVVGPGYGYRPRPQYYRHAPRYYRAPRYYGYSHPRYRRW